MDGPPPTDFDPRIHAAEGAVALDLPNGGLLLGTRRGANTVVLDPFEAQIWAVLDAGATIGDLVDDVRWVASELGWERDIAVQRLHGLLWMLNGAGLVTGQELTPMAAEPRWPAVPMDSSMGRRLGLRSAVTWFVPDPDGRPLAQFGMTDGPHVERIEEFAAGRIVRRLDPGFEEGLPFTFLRVTPGTTPRRQQVFGPRGEYLLVDHDPAVATRFLLSTVAGHSNVTAGAAGLIGLPLRHRDRVIVVHPKTVSDGISSIYPMLVDAGIEIGRGAVTLPIRTSDGRVVLREPAIWSSDWPAEVDSDPNGGRRLDDDVHRLNAVIVPAGVGESLVEQRVMEMLPRWDHTHLALLDRLRSDVPFVEIEVGSGALGFLDLIREALAS